MDKVARYSKGVLVSAVKAANSGHIPMLDNMVNSNTLSKGFIDELGVSKQQKQQLKTMTSDVEKTNTEITKHMQQLNEHKSMKSASLLTMRGVITNAQNVVTDIIAKGGTDAFTTSVAWKQKKEHADEMSMSTPFQLHNLAPSNKFKAGSSYTTHKSDYDSVKRNLTDMENKLNEFDNKIKTTQNQISILNKKVTDLQERIRDGVT